MSDSRQKVRRSKAVGMIHGFVGIGQLLLGCAILLFFGFCTYVAIKETFSSQGPDALIFIICFAFDILGIWLVVLSGKRRKLVKLFREYAPVLFHSPDGSIAAIAATLGTAQYKVRGNLEKMIKKHLLRNAYIDRKANRIVIEGMRNAKAAADSAAGASEMAAVRCPACGAGNAVVKGKVGRCDYCGSVIKGE